MSGGGVGDAEQRWRFAEALVEAIASGASVRESPHVDSWVVMRPSQWMPRWQIVLPIGGTAAFMATLDAVKAGMEAQR